MERDPQLSRLIREGGVIQAPEGFTGKVMDLVITEPKKQTYKPLIGKSGRIFIILFIITIVVISIIFAEPGERILKPISGILNPGWQLPEINLDFSFLQDINMSTGIVAVLAALFILVLSDAGISKRKFVL